MQGQRSVQSKGGSMRLGACPCTLLKGSRAHDIYAEPQISERHRHRFEVNNDFRQTLIQAGLIVSGTSPDGQLVEIIELADHPWFIGVQFHPEFKSTPRTPHPLFRSFILAALSYRDAKASAPKESEQMTEVAQGATGSDKKSSDTRGRKKALHVSVEALPTQETPIGEAAASVLAPDRTATRTPSHASQLSLQMVKM
jgi:hypothetical protein